MNIIDRLFGGLRKIMIVEEKMARLEQNVERLDAAVDDLDRRMVRLETVIQMAGGATLPPLSPQLPRR